jgi:hypothetical protein
MMHVRSIREAHERFDEIIDLGNIGAYETDVDAFNHLPEAERLRRGALLGEHWEAIAAECERSRATRLLFNRWTPSEMRAEAAVWREGRDPRWEPTS